MALINKSNPQDEDRLFEFVGDLDESLIFPTDKFKLSQRIIIDCGAVTHMNSYAAQMLSHWMREQDPRQQFVLRRVPPRMINKFNLIDGFLPNECVIESFYVPYECEQCEHEELLLAVRGKDYIESVAGAPAKLRLDAEINCTKCKSGMKLGIWEAKYLRFLNTP